MANAKEDFFESRDPNTIRVQIKLVKLTVQFVEEVLELGGSVLRDLVADFG